MSDFDPRNGFVALDPGNPAVPALGRAVHLWSLETRAAGARAVRTATRTALEQLLERYADGAAFTIETGRHGKPFAVGLPQLDFNVSHAGAHAVFAFARDQALGVDIEQRSRTVSVDGISARFFSAREAAALAGLEPDRRLDAFLQLWTQKEAVLKAVGEGLAFGLDRVSFELAASGSAGPMRSIAPEAGQPHEWQVRCFAPSATIVGSLAWRGPPRELLMFRLKP